MFILDPDDPRSRKSVENMRKQVRLEPDENIVCFFDGSLFPAGMKGFVVTDRRIINYGWIDQDSVPLGAIQNVALDLNNKVLSIHHQGGVLNLNLPRCSRKDEEICQKLVTALGGKASAGMPGMPGYGAMHPGGVGPGFPSWPGPAPGGESAADVVAGFAGKWGKSSTGSSKTEETEIFTVDEDTTGIPGTETERILRDTGVKERVTKRAHRLGCGCIVSSVSEIAGYCDVCKKPICKKHLFYCHNCGKPICIKHSKFRDGNPYCSWWCHWRYSKRQKKAQKKMWKQELEMGRRQLEEDGKIQIEQIKWKAKQKEIEEKLNKGKKKLPGEVKSEKPRSAWIIKKTDLRLRRRY